MQSLELFVRLSHSLSPVVRCSVLGLVEVDTQDKYVMRSSAQAVLDSLYDSYTDHHILVRLPVLPASLDPSYPNASPCSDDSLVLVRAIVSESSGGLTSTFDEAPLKHVQQVVLS
jgi:hypothetical protein